MYNRYFFDDMNYYIALYIRLSREDGDDLESESITNQRSLLLNFLDSHKLKPVEIYIDDGFSGGNFERPAFKRMLTDLENKKINCVITKDLSRLGRDFIETGRYVERYFPENHIRYIALNDDIDTFNEHCGGSDMMPFKLGMNDMYAKDISKKVRATLYNMKRDGKFCGSHPSYGYLRDPEDKHHLIPDPETAPIVKKIFELYLDGYGISKIADIMTKEGYITPIVRKLREESVPKKYHPEIWKPATVNNILRNRTYTGCTIQHTSQNVNYKSKIRRKVPKSEWMIKENTHEALIDKDTFDIVQSMRNKSNNYDENRRNVDYALSGLVYCKDCGQRMSINYDKYRDRTFMNCTTYRRMSKYNICFSHYVNYKKLEKTINDSIRKLANKYKKDEKEFESLIKNQYIDSKEELRIKINSLKKELSSLENKQDTLYDDRFNGIITVETYQRLYNATENKIGTVKMNIRELENKLKNIKDDDSLVLNNKKIIEDFLSIKEPTKEMLHKIIDKIYINKDKEVEVHYKVCNN